MFIRFWLLVFGFCFSSLTFAQGFSNQGDATQDTDQYTSEQLLAFSKKVEKSLADKGAMVALVSRVGRPESELPEGVKYTHVALWVYSDIETKDGRKLNGYQVYNLYQREKQKNVSDLINDFPVDFYAGVYELKSGIIIPKPSLQIKLLKVIQSPAYQKLHNPKYSVVAKADSTKYQNCTSFVLKVLFSALYDTDDIAQINANTRAYFTPQVIKLGSVKRFFGSLFVTDFYDEEKGAEITTATYTTIAKFMQKYDLVNEVYELKN